MTLLAELTRTALDPALALLPSKMDTPEARVELLAICGQEADWCHRVQIVDGGGRGPARGLLQFERGGGVRGVMEHPSSRYWARSLCDAIGVRFNRMTVWSALERSDVLAFGFGRLLLFTDPKPLPNLGDAAGAWAYYLRNWRPGKPHPKAWPEKYRAALEHTTGANA